MPEDSVVAGPELVPLTTVTIKLPTFWTDSQEVWLLQAKAQFENKRITTSQTKFTHCVVSPLQDVTCRLLDLVRSPQVSLVHLLSESINDPCGMA